MRQFLYFCTIKASKASVFVRLYRLLKVGALCTAGEMTWQAAQREEHVQYFCTSKASKLSTWHCARAHTHTARKTQQCHLLKRKIDDVASRAELVQYERRFVEVR